MALQSPALAVGEYDPRRGGSVGLNSICQVVNWISALFKPLPGLAVAV